MRILFLGKERDFMAGKKFFLKNVTFFRSFQKKKIWKLPKKIRKQFFFKKKPTSSIFFLHNTISNHHHTRMESPTTVKDIRVFGAPIKKKKQIDDEPPTKKKQKKEKVVDLTIEEEDETEEETEDEMDELEKEIQTEKNLVENFSKKLSDTKKKEKKLIEKLQDLEDEVLHLFDDMTKHQNRVLELEQKKLRFFVPPKKAMKTKPSTSMEIVPKTSKKTKGKTTTTVTATKKTKPTTTTSLKKQPKKPPPVQQWSAPQLEPPFMTEQSTKPLQFPSPPPSPLLPPPPPTLPTPSFPEHSFEKRSMSLKKRTLTEGQKISFAIVGSPGVGKSAMVNFLITTDEEAKKKNFERGKLPIPSRNQGISVTRVPLYVSYSEQYMIHGFFPEEKVFTFEDSRDSSTFQRISNKIDEIQLSTGIKKIYLMGPFSPLEKAKNLVIVDLPGFETETEKSNKRFSNILKTVDFICLLANRIPMLHDYQLYVRRIFNALGEEYIKKHLESLPNLCVSVRTDEHEDVSEGSGIDGIVYDAISRAFNSFDVLPRQENIKTGEMMKNQDIRLHQRFFEKFREFVFIPFGSDLRPIYTKLLKKLRHMETKRISEKKTMSFVKAPYIIPNLFKSFYSKDATEEQLEHSVNKPVFMEVKISYTNNDTISIESCGNNTLHLSISTTNEQKIMEHLKQCKSKFEVFIPEYHDQISYYQQRLDNIKETYPIYPILIYNDGMKPLGSFELELKYTKPLIIQFTTQDMTPPVDERSLVVHIPKKCIKKLWEIQQAIMYHFGFNFYWISTPELYCHFFDYANEFVGECTTAHLLKAMQDIVTISEIELRFWISKYIRDNERHIFTGIVYASKTISENDYETIMELHSKLREQKKFHDRIRLTKIIDEFLRLYKNKAPTEKTEEFTKSYVDSTIQLKNVQEKLMRLAFLSPFPQSKFKPVHMEKFPSVIQNISQPTQQSALSFVVTSNQIGVNNIDYPLNPADVMNFIKKNNQQALQLLLYSAESIDENVNNNNQK